MMRILINRLEIDKRKKINNKLSRTIIWIIIKIKQIYGQAYRWEIANFYIKE